MDIKALSLPPVSRSTPAAPAGGAASAALETGTGAAAKVGAGAKASAAYPSTQAVGARSAAGQPATAQTSTTQTPAQLADSGLPRYISPVIQVDPSAKVAFLAFRDASTGEITNSIPAKQVLERYRQNGGPPVDSAGLPRSQDANQSGGAEQVGGGKTGAARVAAAYGRQSAGGAATAGAGVGSEIGAGSGASLGGAGPTDPGAKVAALGGGRFGATTTGGPTTGGGAGSATGAGSVGGGGRVSLTV